MNTAAAAAFRGLEDTSGRAEKVRGVSEYTATECRWGKNL